MSDRGRSRNLLGKFPESKLAVLGVSLVSLGAVSGALALAHDTGGNPAVVVEPAPVLAEGAPVSTEPAPQIIRRIVVIVGRGEENEEIEQWAEPAPVAPAVQSMPVQPQPDPAPQATPQPVTRSRGS